MGTQLVLSFAKRLFFNLCNALNPKPNSQTIRILSPYRNISLFSLVFILHLYMVTCMSAYFCMFASSCWYLLIRMHISAYLFAYVCLFVCIYLLICLPVFASLLLCAAFSLLITGSFV